MDPDAPTVTATVTSADTAAGAVATTRTVAAPASSPTADNASSDASVRLNAIRPSVICNPAPVTVTAEPPTLADPDSATVSTPSAVPSSRAVMLNDALALTDPAAMLTVNMFPVASVVKSPEAPNVAVPPATVTVTSVAEVRADDEAPSKAAVTVTCWAEFDSDNTAGSADNTTSESASAITRSAELTVCPVAEPVNLIVSGPSVTVSETGVTVTSAYPEVAPEAIVTVAEEPAE